MSSQSTISAAAATRDRTGVNHIGRLVELWLSRYEHIDELKRAKPARAKRPQQTKTSVGASANSQTKRAPGSSALPVADLTGAELAGDEVQNTFSFYHGSKS